MDGISPAELVERLRSDEAGVRKMSVYKLQTAICDPSFADVFAAEGGLEILKQLCLDSSGNTLAYSLTGFSNLLEIDKGWEMVDQMFVKRVVQLVVQEPLVNILRGAMAILVAIVQHTSGSTQDDAESRSRAGAANAESFGFRALKPVILAYPQFLEMLVARLSSADHTLCANALQLINSLMRDAVTTAPYSEWPKFIKNVQDLGVIRAVYTLMQSTALQDLAQPLLEFQTLTKILLRKWRDVPVDMKRVEHQKAIRGIRDVAAKAIELEKAEARKRDGTDVATPQRPSSVTEPWKRLGFEGVKLEPEFEKVGFLGVMDLADYVRKNEDGFEKLLLEQGFQPAEKRCPIARASIAITAILYKHFEIDKPDLDDVKGYLALDSRNSVDRLFKPMLLQWSKLHTAGLQGFLRLWKATGAEIPDFDQVSELARILIDVVVGPAPRTKEISAVEEEFAGYNCQQLRELQMEFVEVAYGETWGEHLKGVREELQAEALQFIKEQRIRCMLAGSWFPMRNDGSANDAGSKAQWRFARLSHNRRSLHYADYETRPATNGNDHPSLDELQDKIDLSLVSSVISNVCASPPSPSSSTATLQPPPTATGANGSSHPQHPTSRIVINTVVAPGSSTHGGGGGGGGTSSIRTATAHTRGASDASAASGSQAGDGGSGGGGGAVGRQERPLLTLYPATPALASEWLDGLLMLLEQAPITEETKKLLETVSSWGLKIRLLNVSFDIANANAYTAGGDGKGALVQCRGVVPSREGLDEDYYYDVFGGA